MTSNILYLKFFSTHFYLVLIVVLIFQLHAFQDQDCLIGVVKEHSSLVMLVYRRSIWKFSELLLAHFLAVEQEARKIIRVTMFIAFLIS